MGKAKPKSPEYISWSKMRERCLSPKSHKWHLYGGRGIEVCKRWEVFANFLADMGPRPPGTTIDRINNDGDYEPGNCRWASHSEQARNRRPPPPPMAGSALERQRPDSLAARARANGVHPDTVYCRIRNGWPEALALTTQPTRPHARERLLSHQGKRMRLSDWARAAGLTESTLRARLKNGRSVAEALSAPARKWTRRGVA